MTNLPYLCMSLFGLTAMWALWCFGFKEAFLDYYRAYLFDCRDQLVDLVGSGRLSYEDPAYQSVRSILNGLIHFGHTFSFPVLAHAMRESHNDPDWYRRSSSLDFEISRLAPNVQFDMRGILGRAHRAHLLYMLADSLLFKFVLAWYLLLSLWGDRKGEQVQEGLVREVQKEAYDAGAIYRPGTVGRLEAVAV